MRAQRVRSKNECTCAQAGTGFPLMNAVLEHKVPQLRRDEILTDTAPEAWGDESAELPW